jgi:putative nucleotidyltransferase with HDIG domain
MFTLALVGVVHWRRWRLSGDTVVLALSIASLLSAEALVSLAFGRMWHLSWWDYHALLLLGFGSAVTAVMLGFLRTRGSEGSLADAYMKDPLHHIARGYPEALKTLVTAVEVRDVYTHGHSRRVTEIAARIGQKMGLPADELRKLVWGAELHDIGKIGIPDHIINKEGPLTTDERRLIEEHPVIGWEIARQARSLDEVLGIVRWHHERVDGTGYPDGLSGQDIPLAARIVAVADVWDALTSDRSYRPAWESAKALEVMTEGRGTQFDESCLDAFLELGWSSGLFESAPAPLEVPVEPGVSV